MPFRFRRSIKILPGIRVNLGKRGASSVSIGGRGARVTLRPGHEPRTTIGLPGTGLSYTAGGQTAAKAHHAAGEAPGPAQRAPIAEPPQDEPLPVGVAWRGWVWLLLIALILGALIVQAIR